MLWRILCFGKLQNYHHSKELCCNWPRLEYETEESLTGLTSLWPCFGSFLGGRSAMSPATSCDNQLSQSTKKTISIVPPGLHLTKPWLKKETFATIKEWKLLKDENFSNSQQRKQHLQGFWWKSSMISKVPVIPANLVVSVSIITIWDALKPLYIIKKTQYLNMRKIHVPGISTLTFVSSLVCQLCKTARYCRKPCSNHLGKHYSPVLISSHQWRHQRNTLCSSSGTLGRFCLFQLWLRF